MIERFVEAARSGSFKVALPEGGDERVVAAARRMQDEQIARPVLLGKPEEIEAAAQAAGVALDGLETIDPAGSEKLEPYTQAYAAARDLDPKVARRMVKRPLYFGGTMVAQGDAHTMVAGVATATALVIQAGVLTVGLTPGIATPSSFFLMVLPDFRGQRDKVFVFADCAVNVAPTADQLADIAVSSAQSARRLLGEEPRVAMLSFSTKGSASHPSIDRVLEALEEARRKAPELKIDGELQLDTAIVPEVAARKLKQPSAVAGQANVLIFPDLNSGNIAYKLTQYLAGARAIGPFLQGFAKPISDLSRGASVDDIIGAASVCLAQVAGE